MVMALVAIATSCTRPPEERGDAFIRLDTPESGPATVAVLGLPDTLLDDLKRERPTPERWAQILRVAVTEDAPAIVGTHTIRGAVLHFTPAFPFDPGREYFARLDHPQVPGRRMLWTRLRMPGGPPTSSTTVTAVYPSGERVPENLLRFYINFSAPMGQSGGLDHVELRDASDRVVEGAFLPLDYEFFDAGRTRFTLFLDPGRVKRGILPNRQSGRAMKNGQRYTLVVKATWRDANGAPLSDVFRKTYIAGPAAMDGLALSDWQVTATPKAVTVAFPQPLDHGLLLRALSVRSHGTEVAGQVLVMAGERLWTFRPALPLPPGRYELVAESILEDPAGNQIGKAFEIDNFEAVDKSPDPKTVALPFVVGG